MTSHLSRPDAPSGGRGAGTGSPPADAGSPTRRMMQRNSFSAFMGGLLEWYDFGLYGWAASLVFQPLFFVSGSPTVGLLAAFATYGIGFVVRPLGGILFGHLGDKVGRKALLVITMAVMGAATFCVGLLPTYDAVGVWAVAGLVLCRVVQGLAVGGEFGGATLIAAEHAPPGSRGFWSSFALVGGPAGLLLSSLVFTAFAAMPDEQFLSWGWRVPFLLSVVVVAVGLYFRRKLDDPEVFQEARARGTDRVPAAQLFRAHKWLMLRALGARLVDAPVSNVFTVFGVSYITHQLGGSPTVALLAGIISNLLICILMPITAALSDRVGRKPVLLAGAAAMTVSPAIGFAVMHIGTTAAILLGVVIGWPVVASLIEGPTPATLTELFPTEIRCSGVSFVYQMQTIMGGATPFIAASLVAATGGRPWLLAAFLGALGVLTVASIASLPDVTGRDLNAEPVPSQYRPLPRTTFRPASPVAIKEHSCSPPAPS